MRIVISGDDWRPDQRGLNYVQAEDLVPGRDVVVLKYTAMSVVSVRLRKEADWSEKYVEAWKNAGMPDPKSWRHRPWVVELRRHHDPKAESAHYEVTHSHFFWVLPEHYAVCSCCGDIPPCRIVHEDGIARRAAKVMEWQMSLLPGCCHACGEPITNRQKSVLFEGPNLIRPDLGNDSVRFHTRQKCWSDAYHYDMRWAKELGRRKKFSCDGFQRQHTDGSRECSLGPECSGSDVQHSGWEIHRPGGGGKWSACWCVGISAS